MVNLSWSKVVYWGGAAALLLTCVASVACHGKPGEKTAFSTDVDRPDALPIMLNKDLPFHYPPSLYAEKAQGNVTLRLYIDTDGAVVNDSTHVVESSTMPALDSAAIKGAHDLRFVPAKRHGVPIPVSILFPVYFRHPEAPAVPGDSLLRKVAPPGSTSHAP